MSTVSKSESTHQVTAESSTKAEHHDLVADQDLPHYARLWRSLLEDKGIAVTDGVWRVMVAGIPQSAHGNDRNIQLICPDRGKLKVRLRPESLDEFARLCFVIPPNGLDANQVFDDLKSKIDNDLQDRLVMMEEESGEPFARLYRQEENHLTVKKASNYYRELFEKRAKAWKDEQPCIDFVLETGELWQAAQWLDRETLLSVIKKSIQHKQAPELVLSLEIYYLIAYKAIVRDDEGFRLGEFGKQILNEMVENSRHRMPSDVGDYLQGLVRTEETARELDTEIVSESSSINTLEQELECRRRDIEEIESRIQLSKARLDLVQQKRSSPEITVPLEELQRVREVLK